MMLKSCCLIMWRMDSTRAATTTNRPIASEATTTTKSWKLRILWWSSIKVRHGTATKKNNISRLYIFIIPLGMTLCCAALSSCARLLFLVVDVLVVVVVAGMLKSKIKKWNNDFFEYKLWKSLVHVREAHKNVFVGPATIARRPGLGTYREPLRDRRSNTTHNREKNLLCIWFSSYITSATLLLVACDAEDFSRPTFQSPSYILRPGHLHTSAVSPLPLYRRGEAEEGKTQKTEFFLFRHLLGTFPSCRRLSLGRSFPGSSFDRWTFYFKFCFINVSRQDAAATAFDSRALTYVCKHVSYLEALLFRSFFNLLYLKAPTFCCFESFSAKWQKHFATARQSRNVNGAKWKEWNEQQHQQRQEDEKKWRVCSGTIRLLHDIVDNDAVLACLLAWQNCWSRSGQDHCSFLLCASLFFANFLYSPMLHHQKIVKCQSRCQAGAK